MITLICTLDKFSFKDYCTCFLTGQRVLPYRQTGKWHHECEIRDTLLPSVCVCVCAETITGHDDATTRNVVRAPVLISPLYSKYIAPPSIFSPAAAVH